jgi:hypothetical protein
LLGGIHAIEERDIFGALIAGKVTVIRRIKPKEPGVITSAPTSICILFARFRFQFGMREARAQIV